MNFGELISLARSCVDHFLASPKVTRLLLPVLHAVVAVSFKAHFRMIKTAFQVHQMNES